MKSFSALLDNFLLVVFRKRLYVFIFKTFVVPFFVSFSIVLVIFLVWKLMQYKKDFAGKGLDSEIYGQVIGYLALSLVPRALPLALMLSSLMTYGNLGQHNELTAIKSAGVSLVRILLPIFFLTTLLSFGSFHYSNVVLPWSNLKLYRLLYDIKHKDPAFDLKEGVFYSDLDGYRIKVERKSQLNSHVYDVMIYDHTKGLGNREVIIADSGMIQLDPSEKYMYLELYDGSRYAEKNRHGINKGQEYTRTSFSETKMSFDMTELQMKNTPEELFSGNRFMLNVDQLGYVVDSLRSEAVSETEGLAKEIHVHIQMDPGNNDSVPILKKLDFNLDFDTKQNAQLMHSVFANSNNLKFMLERRVNRKQDYIKNANKNLVEKYHRYSDAVACLILFLIGAPIGAVLKKGGIGLPTLLTVLGFILHYVMTIIFEKYARANLIHPIPGGWGAIFALSPIAIFFMYQAYRDARLFELDGYLRLFKSKKKNA